MKSMPDPHHLAARPLSAATSSLRKIFIGPFGLRAGWSLLIYISFLAVAAFAAYTIMHHVQNDSTGLAPSATKSPAIISSGAAPSSPSGTIAQPQGIKELFGGEFGALAALLLLCWGMAFMEGRPVGVYGLGDPHFLLRFLYGASGGLAAMSLVIGLLFVGGLLKFDNLLEHGLAILGWGSAQLVTFLVVGLLEEYFFRGYLQFTLTRGLVSLGNLLSPAHATSIAFWTASALTSVIFFASHAGNPAENYIGLISVLFAGFIFVVALRRTGTLWWAVGFHTAWDWAQSFLYGVPDSGQLVEGRLFATHSSGNPLFSGGTAGPEGSLLQLPVLALVIAALFFFYPSPKPLERALFTVRRSTNSAGSSQT